MNARLMLVLSCVAAGAAPGFAADMPGHTMVTADKVAWGPAPPGLPPGSQAAVIDGDPGKPGPFTLRAKLPAGYKIPPHWHATDEHVTVLSGTIAMGTGETWEDNALMTMPMGAYMGMAPGTRHYLLAKTEAIIQVHGTGPFAITYVNPKDDPRIASSTK
jgi:quercetin dioxygenase-like cupin family protein